MRKDIVANVGLSVPLGLAAVAWIYLAGASHLTNGLPLCIGGNNGFGTKIQSALDAQWTILDQRIGITWAAMVVAMMVPIAATHLSVAVAKTLPRYRLHVLSAAIMGYVGVWLLLGLPYIGLFLMAAALESTTIWPFAPIILYALAITWSFTPLRQKALRRCHPVPAFFGDGKDHAKAAGIWGVKLARYCAILCFFAMSAPMLSGQGLIGMMIATHILLAERRALRPQPRLVAIPLALLFVAALVHSVLT